MCRLGPFGAVFMPGSLIPAEAVIYAARSALRLWKADIDGVVQTTLMFTKSSTKPPRNHTSQTTTDWSRSETETKTMAADFPTAQFGLLHVYCGRLLVSHTSTELLVVSPEETKQIMFMYTDGRKSMLDVAVNRDEIFVLRRPSSHHERPLIRLAQQPQQFSSPPVTAVCASCIYAEPHHSIHYRSTENAGGWGRSAMKLTSRVFSALTNLSGSFVSVQDGGILSPNNSAVAVAGDSEMAEDAMLKVVNEQSLGQTVCGVDSVPTVKLDPSDIAPVQVAVDAVQNSAVNDVVQQFSTLTCFEGSADLALRSFSFSSESGSRTMEELVTDKQSDDQDNDDIVFSSGTRRKIRRTKQPKNKLPNDSWSASSLESYATDHPLQLSDSPALLSSTTTAITDQRSSLNATNARSSHNLRVDNKVPVTVSCDLASHSADMKHCFVDNDSKSASDTARLESPCIMATNTLQVSADTLSIVSSSNSTTSCLLDDSAGAQNTSEAAGFPVCSSELDSENTQMLKYAVEASGATPANSVICSESKRDADFHNSLSLNANSASDSSGAVKTGLCVSVDSAIPSHDFTATVLSPSEDFQSIYASKASPLAASTITEGTPVSQPQTTHSYLDSDSTDAWLEFPVPGKSAGPAQSLCISRRTVWYVDKTDHLFYSSLKGPGLSWTSVSQPTQQISCSPSGYIVWRVYRGSAYSAVGRITGKSPTGTEWREVAREVAYVAADDSVVWYVKANGEVRMQKGLSRERTSYRSLNVPCDEPLVLVCCRKLIVWAVTAQDRRILVRHGVDSVTEEGCSWSYLDGFGASLSVSDLDIDAEWGLVWVVDVEGRVRFTTGVSAVQPHGTGCWWQVSTSGYIVSGLEHLRLAKAWKEVPQRLSGVDGARTGGGSVSAAAGNGVWISLVQRHGSLRVCRSSITGCRWESVTPVSSMSLSRWKHLIATQLHTSSPRQTFGIWLQQSSGSVFYLFTSPGATSRGRLQEVVGPATVDDLWTANSVTFSTFSATPDALCGLMTDGRLFVRTGMGSHCPTGVSWSPVNLPDLGKSQLVDVALTQHNVWAVDSIGNIFFHFGPPLQSPALLNNQQPSSTSSWQAVGSLSDQNTGAMSWAGNALKQTGSALKRGGLQATHIVRLYAGYSADSMVWAIDNRQNVLVREGITEDVPCGTLWTSVSGITAESLCVSDNCVYALSTEQHCFARHGITPDCPQGAYWKKFPGLFSAISVTSSNCVWALDQAGALYRCDVCVLPCQSSPTKSTANLSVVIDNDWQIV